MLGHKLVQVYREKYDLWTTIRGKFDDYRKYKIFDKDKIFERIEIENFDSIEEIIKRIKPDVIINAVGIVKQIPNAKDVVKTLTVNSIFPHRLSEISQQNQSRLIHISTDCVFDGRKGKYLESDVSDAFDLYGKSKNLGEITSENCLTLRTSIIGRELTNPHSLVEWFLSNQGKTVKGFTRAVFSGFPTIILAEIISDIIDNHTELSGLYHVSSKPINKFDLLELLKEAYQLDIQIEPFDGFEIDRSLDSTKFAEETGFVPMDWSQMVRKMAEDNALYSSIERKIF